MIFAQRYGETGLTLSEPWHGGHEHAYYHAPREWFVLCLHCNELTAHPDWHAARKANRAHRRTCPRYRPTKRTEGRRFHRKRDGWTEAEDAILATATPSQAVQQLPGRTYAAVTSRRGVLRANGLPVGPVDRVKIPWTTADDELIRTHNDAQVAAILGRTVGSVRGRRERLNREMKRAS